MILIISIKKAATLSQLQDWRHRLFLLPVDDFVAAFL